MTTMTLSPPLPIGVYILQEDVPNPKCNKRQTHDWRHVPVFLKGLKVRIAIWTIPRSSGDMTVFVMEAWHDHSHKTLALDDTRALALLPRLTPITNLVDVTDERVRQLTSNTLASWSAVVLGQLLQSGELLPERVIALIQEIHERVP